MKTENTAFQKMAVVWQAFCLGALTGVAVFAWYCTRTGLISDSRFGFALAIIFPFLIFVGVLPSLCAQAHAGIRNLKNSKMQNKPVDHISEVQ